MSHTEKEYCGKRYGTLKIPPVYTIQATSFRQLESFYFLKIDVYSREKTVKRRRKKQNDSSLVILLWVVTGHCLRIVLKSFGTTELLHGTTTTTVVHGGVTLNRVDTIRTIHASYRT